MLGIYLASCFFGSLSVSAWMRLDLRCSRKSNLAPVAITSTGMLHHRESSCIKTESQLINSSLKCISLDRVGDIESLVAVLRGEVEFFERGFGGPRHESSPLDLLFGSWMSWG